MSKQKIAIIIISFLFFFVGGLNFARAATPSYCSLPRDTAIELNGISGPTYDSKCNPSPATPAATISTNSDVEKCDPATEYVNEEGTCSKLAPALEPSAETWNEYQGGPTGTSGSASGVGMSLSSVGGSGDLAAIAGATGLPNPAGGLKAVLMRVLNWMLGIFGALALLAFVISGIMYLTAAGETTRIDKAKTAMTWSIIGVVIGLGGVIIIQTIDFLLR
jgi:hypothetical protein